MSETRVFKLQLIRIEWRQVCVPELQHQEATPSLRKHTGKHSQETVKNPQEIPQDMHDIVLLQTGSVVSCWLHHSTCV